jgi:hypothetical protein
LSRCSEIYTTTTSKTISGTTCDPTVISKTMLDLFVFFLSSNCINMVCNMNFNWTISWYIFIKVICNMNFDWTHIMIQLHKHWYVIWILIGQSNGLDITLTWLRLHSYFNLTNNNNLKIKFSYLEELSYFNFNLNIVWHILKPFKFCNYLFFAFFIQSNLLLHLELLLILEN